MAKKYYENRELSWLKFNYRVLEEARDNSVPLLERLSFASIFLSNLDEFYRVRTGALIRQSLDDDSQKDARTKLRPSKQLELIHARTKKLYELFDMTVADIESHLAAIGAKRKKYSALTDGERSYCSSFAEHELRPRLSVHENAKSFFAENGKVYYAFECGSDIYILDYKGDHSSYIGLGGSGSYILSDEVIFKNAQEVIGKKPTFHCTFKVTRSAALDLDTDYMAERDRREEMKKLVLRRKKMPPVRLEIRGCKSASFKDSLCRLLRIDEDMTFERKSPLSFDYVGELRDSLKDREELFYHKQPPVKSVLIDRSRSMIEQIEKQDILLFYPYEDISDFIRLLKEASDDDRVKRISITLYRAAHDSEIISAICDAARKGKDVLALVELRARFDEENNIIKAKKLKEAGCRVIFGMPSIKVHSKVCLIEYTDGDQTKYITQVGTGNYNEKTSRIYTDLSLMTASEDIANDARELFVRLEEGRLVERSDALMISPLCLKSKLIDMMDAEITAVTSGGEGYIGAKVNSLTDKKIIKKLVECSEAGVKVELVIRGICCLVPGIEGKTDNIRVVSIVGRYLEHSRIYIFGSSSRRKVFISSADFMTRNLSRRVEAAAPIRDEQQRERVFEYFKMQLGDKVRGRVLCSDGVYRREQYDDGQKDSQQTFYELTAGMTEPEIQLSQPDMTSSPENTPKPPQAPEIPEPARSPAEEKTEQPPESPAEFAPVVYTPPVQEQPAAAEEPPKKRGLFAWLRRLFSK
ncbi:MAG: polyphosphate kinase 1 [Ruminococcus sp.]|nr:polyphosphate kinase 1 [Ruminococcus sp.]